MWLIDMTDVINLYNVTDKSGVRESFLVTFFKKNKIQWSFKEIPVGIKKYLKFNNCFSFVS